MDDSFPKENVILTDDSDTDLIGGLEIIHSMQARQAAQYGDVDTLRTLLDSGQATPCSVDSDDCSLLHWAAINNRLEVAELLIERKCNVNAVGGVLSSTPLHWAARHGHARMVALLVRNGANCAIRDVEGFTPLHVAVQFGCTPVAAYLIAKGQCTPDDPDDTYMTPAMWAAYKVYNVDPLSMLATLGADLTKVDGTYHNTSLHWAVVQGNHTAINTLLKLNVDLTALNKEKETPLDIARRKNDVLATRLLETAARQRKLSSSSCRQTLRENKKFAKGAIFSLPFFAIALTGLVLSVSLEYPVKAFLLAGIAFAIFACYRYFARDWREEAFLVVPVGIAVSSKAFFVSIWIVYLHANTPWHMQIAFFFFLILVPYLFARIYSSDPGVVEVSHKERCAMIVEMTENPQWRGTFCPTCMLTRPPRSKHCKFCDRCVLKFDHHCAFLSNCVGEHNHRIFIVYLCVLVISAMLVFVGCLYYWRDVCGDISWINVLFCKPWVSLAALMSTLFSIWISVMLFIQTYQIITAMTTNERLNSHRYAHFHLAGNRLNVQSPFTQGYLANIQNFWCPTEREKVPNV